MPSQAEERGWRAFAAVALVMAAVFLVYWPTTVSMVQTWARSETYKHCFLVAPAVLWFVWQSRSQLAVIPANPWWPALIPLAGAGALWLTGELASALAPSQWALVLMVPFSTLALFGLQWGRVLAFPLVFLLFAVPFGEAFTPTLIDWTADFTVAALRAAGVPVFREGPHFIIPSGRWSVVEACSGIRYLTASVVVGTLYAWTLYRSPMRRGVFIAASFLVPIVANWLRAFLIVMLGHLSSNRLAVGVDHFIYGWLFFGIVIGLMFWIGARWREDQLPAQFPSALANDGLVVETRFTSFSPMVVAVAVLVLGWPLAARTLGGLADHRPVQVMQLAPAGSWTQAAQAASAWTPHLVGQAETQVLNFSRDGKTVTVFIGWYYDQAQGRELVNSANRLVPESGAAVQIAHGSADVQFANHDATIRTATIRDMGQRLRVWHWYWLGDRIEASDTRAKLSLALDRLLVRTDTSAWVAVFVEAETDAEGDQVLTAFLREMGPAFKGALIGTSAK